MGKEYLPHSLLESLTYPSMTLITHLTDVGLVGIRQHCPNSADTPLTGISSHDIAWNMEWQNMFPHTAGDHFSTLNLSRKNLFSRKGAPSFYYSHGNMNTTRRCREFGLEELEGTACVEDTRGKLSLPSVEISAQRLYFDKTFQSHPNKYPTGSSEETQTGPVQRPEPGPRWLRICTNSSEEEWMVDVIIYFSLPKSLHVSSYTIVQRDLLTGQECRCSQQVFCSS